ncbi:hypothetical protein THAOC_29359, partial [Thalassiosira oceanica]
MTGSQFLGRESGQHPGTDTGVTSRPSPGSMGRESRHPPALPAPTLPDIRGIGRNPASGARSSNNFKRDNRRREGMSETRKRARTGNEEEACAPAAKNPQSPESTCVAAAVAKIAELQAELEA